MNSGVNDGAGARSTGNSLRFLSMDTQRAVAIERLAAAVIVLIVAVVLYMVFVFRP